MLQSLVSQRVGHDLVTEQQQHSQILVYYNFFFILSLVGALLKVTQVTPVNVKVEYESWNVEFSKM